ncbi:MAG TPA: carboxypeptidase regulatory-like domain-containing protein [Bryobacteraceae bacterium]|nr:carboxypeptidase regulatory-like domain-containing protein [Bryobacteraceae bacterium]
MMSKPPRSAALIIAGVLVVLFVVVWRIRSKVQYISVITGAVIAQHANPHLQRPVASAAVMLQSGTLAWKTESGPSGLFRVRLDPAVAWGEPIQLRVSHADYQPFSVMTSAGEQIHVVRLTASRVNMSIPAASYTTLSNIRVRYATRSRTTSTVGAAVETFQIANAANVPCERRAPCSPDGKWKATVGSLTLQAGEQKHFRNVRASCIAGPCPFTSVESDTFSRGGPAITVSIRNWSDPVTYLVEAEVAQTMDSDMIRYTYPVAFGTTMNFTLPADASGPSIEAEVDGMQIVYPLGPELRLSWATCRFEAGADATKQYRCELKPRYRFG